MLEFSLSPPLPRPPGEAIRCRALSHLCKLGRLHPNPFLRATRQPGTPRNLLPNSQADAKCPTTYPQRVCALYRVPYRLLLASDAAKGDDSKQHESRRSSTHPQSALEDLTLTAASELRQAKGILKNFKVCPVRPALDGLTIYVLIYLRHSGNLVKASDSAATLIACLEQRIASLNGGATAEAVTMPRQPLQPAARP